MMEVEETMILYNRPELVAAKPTERFRNGPASHFGGFAALNPPYGKNRAVAKEFPANHESIQASISSY